MTLPELLTKPPHRDGVVRDCVSLIDDEVRRKGGLSGLAVKGAYSLVKTIKPRFVADVVDTLLDDWVAKLTPFHASWVAAGKPTSLGDHLSRNGAAVSDALLSVTDARARTSKNGTAKKAYEKLRPSALKHVEEALPGLGKLVERHAAEAERTSAGTSAATGAGGPAAADEPEGAKGPEGAKAPTAVDSHEG